MHSVIYDAKVMASESCIGSRPSLDPSPTTANPSESPPPRLPKEKEGLGNVLLSSSSL